MNTELIKELDKILPVVEQVHGEHHPELSDAQGTQTVTLPLSGRKLAHFLGTTPETLFRRWSALEKERLVRKKGKQVTLLDREKLEESLL